MWGCEKEDWNTLLLYLVLRHWNKGQEEFCINLWFVQVTYRAGAYGGEERCEQGSGGETWGKETIGETQT